MMTGSPEYSRTQKRFFQMLMDSQYWSAAQFLAYQRQQLAPLLRHARASVPFYANRLDAVFEGDEIRWEHWRELPIVTRDDLLQSRVEMQARSLAPSHGSTANFSTSGSTGAPITTTHNASATLAADATLLRMYQWHDLDWGRDLVNYQGDDPDIDGYPEGGLGGKWGPAWEEAATGQMFKINRHADALEAIEFMERKGVAYFRGGGTDLRMLAYEGRRVGSKLRLHAAMARSCVITEYLEQLVDEAFQAKVVPYYSSKEGHKMAHRCPLKRTYHVAPEVVLLEVLRPNGEPCSFGETGKVVITPLFSYAQPLIRYEQGDLATVGEPCECGRSLPVLGDVLGRVKHMCRLPDGRTIAPPTLPSTVLVGLQAREYQFAQLALDMIEVRYIPADDTVVGDEQALAAAIRTKTTEGMNIRFKRIDSFNVPLGRKHLEFVSELGLLH